MSKNRNHIFKERRETWRTKNSPCKQCLSWVRLELDHLNLEEKSPFLRKHSSVIWSWGTVRREAELLKCQALCHDCHKIKSDSSLIKELIHGTWRMYRNGCRCPICKDFVNSYARENRKKSK